MTSLGRVCVTGGTGSFGRAFLTRCLRDHLTDWIAVLSRDEAKQHVLRQAIPDPRLRCFLGDVRDRDRLTLAFRSVQTVIHAAALKQVPAGEYNPSEFIRTNILGTENVLLAAAEAGVERVIVLSSDKAAAPVNLYGATKATAEHLTRAAQHYSQGTRYACLRYGNVAGSTGSVIPVWRKLAAEGTRTLPLTHIDMTRFWIRLDQAVDLCLETLDRMEGGELVVPKLPSFYLRDLAFALGFTASVTDVRPGEKLAETMVTADEAPWFRDHGDRYIRHLPHIETGTPLPAGFSYSTDRNEHWLTVDDLKAELETL